MIRCTTSPSRSVGTLGAAPLSAADSPSSAGSHCSSMRASARIGAARRPVAGIAEESPPAVRSDKDSSRSPSSPARPARTVPSNRVPSISTLPPLPKASNRYREPVCSPIVVKLSVARTPERQRSSRLAVSSASASKADPSGLVRTPIVARTSAHTASGAPNRQYR
jgi:hypothetical protein